MGFVNFKFVWIPFDRSQTKSIESRFDVTLSTFLSKRTLYLYGEKIHWWPRTVNLFGLKVGSTLIFWGFCHTIHKIYFLCKMRFIPREVRMNI